MIADHDRSGWIGASDVRYVIGNWNTKSWDKWWRVKLGLEENHFQNEAMMAGTAYEHRILEEIGCPEMDKQILLPDIRLRVNLDGNDDDTIYEVKTFRWDKGFKVPIHYKQQVLVQMFASGLRKAEIVAYGLETEDYRNFFRDIDAQRLQRFPITYDDDFIKGVFLPKLKILADALKGERYP